MCVGTAYLLLCGGGVLRVKETAETAKENLLGSLGAVADSTPLAGALASVPSEPMNLMESSADTWGWGSLPDDTPAGARLDQLSTQLLGDGSQLDQLLLPRQMRV